MTFGEVQVFGQTHNDIPVKSYEVMTPRFNIGAVTMYPDTAASFGRYDGSLAACDGAAGRCMQLNLRYTF